MRTVLTIEQILSWADQWRDRYGDWPGHKDGRISESISTTWRSIDRALRDGYRGLRGGSTLAQLLHERRGVRNPARLPPLTVKQILRWADAHWRGAERWPTAESGAIATAPDETWRAVDEALRRGGRGLPWGSSLARLLAEKRGARNRMATVRLTVELILAWADDYHALTGEWPKHDQGRASHTYSIHWRNIDNALRLGLRGLPGGSSLAQLLQKHRGVRNVKRLAPLTLEQVLAWADTHHQQTGCWPNEESGEVVKAPGEVWRNIDAALRQGHRGFPGGSTLARVLAEYRGVRNRMALPSLTEAQILAWADAHQERTGQWPKIRSGPVHDAPGETWLGIESALDQGCRGLPGGDSLYKLLKRSRQIAGRKVPSRAPKPRPWTEEELRLLGTMADAELADKIGRPPNAIRVKRTRLGLPSACDGRCRKPESLPRESG